MGDPVRVQFLWHLHQPYYGLPTRPTNYLPWVRLHAVKSYYDMACMLHRHPDIKATFNFSGSLLRQLREYVEEGRRDTWWDLSSKNAAELDEYDKRHLLRHFFSINWENCIKPYPRYHELLLRRGTDASTTDTDAFGVDDYRDLQVWFNLAWFGFSAREERQIVRELIEKGSSFTEAEKEALLEQQIDVMQHIVPLYRELHRRGQIELTVTPMYHPILPLVIDTDAAKRATPDRPVPPRFTAPEDASEQVWLARTIARDFLGIDVDGMWPAEGSISPEAVEIFARHEVRWIASDEDVLRASRGASYVRERDLYRPWRLKGHDTAIFFRDHGMSDTIGFVYSKNDPERAAHDFVSRCRQCPGPTLNVILDGENPWEHYRNDGREFLDALYRQLAETDRVVTSLPAEFLDDVGCHDELSHLHSGSWILGNYQIWIGHEETNRGWEYLQRARRDLVEHLENHDVDPEAEEAAWEALYVAEGSDWFWWYGDDFSSENDADFDRLFREQIRFVYTVVGAETPDWVDEPIAGTAAEEPEFEPPVRFISPQIDGRATSFYEWEGAGVYHNRGSHGSMFESVRYVDTIRIGFDLDALFVRIDVGDELHDPSELIVTIQIQHERGTFRVLATSDGGGKGEVEWVEEGSSLVLGEVAFGSNVEIAIPFDDLELAPNDAFSIAFTFANEEMELERHPPRRGIEMKVPDRTFERRNWIV